MTTSANNSKPLSISHYAAPSNHPNSSGIFRECRDSNPDRWVRSGNANHGAVKLLSTQISLTYWIIT